MFECNGKKQIYTVTKENQIWGCQKYDEMLWNIKKYAFLFIVIAMSFVSGRI